MKINSLLEVVPSTFLISLVDKANNYKGIAKCNLL